MEHPFPGKTLGFVGGCTGVHPYMWVTIRCLNERNG